LIIETVAAVTGLVDWAKVLRHTWDRTVTSQISVVILK